MDSISCEFCNKKFNTKSNLKIHQKNAKYCLELRGERKEETKEFICEFCNKKFITIDKLENHKIRCYIKLQYDQKELLTSIKNLVNLNFSKKLEEEKETPIILNFKETIDSVEKLDLFNKIETLKTTIFNLSSLNEHYKEQIECLQELLEKEREINKLEKEKGLNK